jgi:cyclophilin family peptidyl-prolyl cis-trans isomerase/outer membrane murein-binding lipoprotein Lpp
MKKAFLVGVALFTSATLLAACSSTPKKITSNDASSNNSTLTQQNSKIKLLTKEELEGNASQTAAQTQKGSTVKTLKDFEPIKASEVTITTNKGDITFNIFQDKVPLTAANFLNLVKSGYYNGIKFHRIIPDFMAQVGDPLTKDDSQKALWGTGGPGYTIADEFEPTLKHDSEGIVSMANAGPNTGGSQFFITYEATPWLDGHHAVFGKVTKGMDVLRKLEIGDQIVKVTYK